MAHSGSPCQLVTTLRSPRLGGVFRVEGPRQPSSRSLGSDKNEPCEVDCTWFVLVEVEGRLVKARSNITSDDDLKLEPEGLNAGGEWSRILGCSAWLTQQC